MPPRFVLVVAAALVAVAAVACTKELDTDDLESRLSDQVRQQIGTEVTSVDCPSDIKVEAGGTFECDATERSGATFTIRVVQTDDDGHVTWDIVNASPSPSP
jgi:hypothetical protein